MTQSQGGPFHRVLTMPGTLLWLARLSRRSFPWPPFASQTRVHVSLSPAETHGTFRLKTTTFPVPSWGKLAQISACLYHTLERTHFLAPSQGEQALRFVEDFPREGLGFRGLGVQSPYSFVCLPAFQNVAWPWNRDPEGEQGGCCHPRPHSWRVGGGVALQPAVWPHSEDPFIVCVSPGRLERASFTQPLFGSLLRRGCTVSGTVQGTRLPSSSPRGLMDQTPPPQTSEASLACPQAACAR